jgi:Fis family transcriptional regulator
MVSDTIKKEVIAKNPLMMKPASLEEDESLEAAVIRNLKSYFETLDGMRPKHELYPMVIQAVEKPLLEFALKRTGHNKCAAAQLLGINRNTLHKKLQFYKLT